jgi:hypothetical protein
MSAHSSPQHPHHRIGILMAPTGRYLECQDCRLRFEFPAEETYDVVARQFESILCSTCIGMKTHSDKR